VLNGFELPPSRYCLSGEIEPGYGMSMGLALVWREESVHESKEGR
jgi:hypothetical protein